VAPEPNTPAWWNDIGRAWLQEGQARDDADNTRTAQAVVGSCVLEVGCGFGCWAARLHDMLPSVQYLGLDLSQVLVSTASNRNPGLVFACCDVLELGSGWHQAFDTVAAFQVLEHYAESAPVVDKLRALARRRLVFSVPRGGPSQKEWDESGHRFGWADDAAAVEYFGRWGEVHVIPGRPCHIVGTVDWRT
jgi:SAM-dependent methyltransferase